MVEQTNMRKAVSTKLPLPKETVFRRDKSLPERSEAQQEIPTPNGSFILGHVQTMNNEDYLRTLGTRVPVIMLPRKRNPKRKQETSPPPR
jgi:hypothetical protein